MRSRALVVTALSVALAACDGGKPAAVQTPPAPSAVAVVDGVAIDAATVSASAAAQHLTPRAALERAVADALAAAEARRRFGDVQVRAARRGALSRVLLEGFAAEARAAGPPTDAEVAQATQKRWWELDRPVLRRTTHAVALVKSPADDARARALAGRIAERVAGISDPNAFRAAASSVPTDGIEVKVEEAPAISPDGSAFDGDATPPRPPIGTLVKEYADAVFAIPAIGRTSPVVKTEFGYHVILAVADIPEHRVPLDERRAMLAPDIIDARATALYDAALQHARSIDSVAIERSAVDSMLLVRTSP